MIFILRFQYQHTESPQIEIESQISKLDQKGKFQEYLLKINDFSNYEEFDQLMDKIETLNNTKILYLLLALSTVGDTTDDDQKSNLIGKR